MAEIIVPDMFLKRIILKNFKSFSGKNVLDFPFAVTAIVGPNGSGKSNIVDALRWALGEQKSKNIRIEQGKDLIFAGNNKETAAGFAEVEVVFDNTNHFFSVDYSEISIARRIDRDGNNNYFLNHQPCRWKDIIELSAQAKLGLKGLSIINQGSVENILRVSPFDLRMMIEENIGLKNLELKKEEAERKIHNTTINLDQVKVREQEIIPHLRFLKRQVKRWEKKDEIEKELKELEKRYFAVLYSRLLSDGKLSEREDVSKDKERIEQAIKRLKQDIDREKKQLDQSNSLSQVDEIRSLTKLVIQLQNQRSELKNKILGEKENKQLVLSQSDFREKLFTLRKRIEALLPISDIKVLKQKIREIKQYLDDILQKKEEKRSHSLSLEEQEELSAIEKQIEEKSKLLDEYQKKAEEKNKMLQRGFRSIEEKRKRIENLLREQQSLEVNQERLSLRLEDLQRRMRERGFDLETIKLFYSQHINSVREDSSQLEHLERRVIYLRREIEAMGEEDPNTIQEYQDVSSRYEFLNKQTEDLEKGISDLRTLRNKLEAQIEQEFNKSLRMINAEFNRYFHSMFRGGTAKLEKIKNTDSLPGIVIKVNVPKTKLRSIEMLSGGEKTLVAISLVFSIINQSHPPLLVVDEIDAALDEENSQRFATILTELSKNTQFIVITHNQLVMKAAQIIYGVTLGENKTSRLLSIQLEEAKNLAKQTT